MRPAFASKLLRSSLTMLHRRPGCSRGVAPSSRSSVFPDLNPRQAPRLSPCDAIPSSRAAFMPSRNPRW